MVHRPPFGKPQTKALALVAGLLVAGFVLRFAFINSQSLGHDEIYTLGFLSGYDAYLFPGANLQPFVADGPWLNHARPAPQNIMLEQSVDLNSVNVWWVRMRHLPVSDSIKRATNAFMLVWILCLGLVCGRMVCLLR
jgi:hypothetical protein